MDKYISAFIRALHETSKSEHTLIAYKKDLEQLSAYLSEKHISKVENITEKSLREYFDYLAKNDLSAKTISRKLNSTRTFFKYLESEKIISNNPASSISHPKIESVQPRILTEMEYRALRDAARVDARTYTIIEILLQTGIRIGELCRIKLPDLDLTKGDKSVLRVSEYGSNTSRSIPLNKKAVSVFKQYLDIRPNNTKTNQLFITKNGNPLLVRNVRASIDNVFRKAGIENAKVNDLRNTFIAHHLARGTNIFILSQIIGHKRISTTEKYMGQIKTELETYTPLSTL